jgi:hypothetical protein
MARAVSWRTQENISFRLPLRISSLLPPLSSHPRASTISISTISIIIKTNETPSTTTTTTTAAATMVRLCGIYLFHCSLRKHLRRAVRKVFNRPAPETNWEENEFDFEEVDGVLEGVRVKHGTQRISVLWATRPGLVIPSPQK